MNNDPNRLENALRSALHREDAPEEFAANVLARVAQKQSHARVPGGNWLAPFSQPLLRWAAFAAVSICLIVGGIYYRNVQRERAQGEAAKQQLMLALRIAGNKLQLAKARVNEINESRPDSKPEPTTPRSRS